MAEDVVTRRIERWEAHLRTRPRDEYLVLRHMSSCSVVLRGQVKKYIERQFFQRTFA
jgi:hypothetical protein